jgi:choline dehydrogenase-like flavoprotein
VADQIPHISGSFDFIIVGSGAAGSVLAARLSENKDVRVCLIEAGGPNRSLLCHLPGLGFAVGAHPKFNWNFATEAVPTMEGRSLPYLQGRVLGGSSSINGMIYTRGHSANYDLWRQAGCAGWGASGVLKYFKKSENNIRGQSQWHGTGGPLPVRPANPNLAICDAFLDAARDSGFPVVNDMNQDHVECFGYYDINSHSGRRMSTAEAFLRPARSRENLTVLTNSVARRVIIERGRACAVETAHDGSIQHIRADREIILSAGAIKSPQLLMLSGIGPADDLRRHGIAVVCDSRNVGENLQNHVCYRPQYLCNAPITASGQVEPFNAAKAGLQYLFSRTGPLAESYASAGGFFKTNSSLDVADAQVVLLSALAPTSSAGSRFRIRDLLPQQHGFGMTIYQGSPHSRGRVTLASDDPEANPKIDPAYFSDPRDMEVLKAAVKRMRAMMQQPAINKYISKEVLPGVAIQSDEDLEADIRRNGATAYHQCGTCAMGSHDDAVLTPELRVRDVQGLRVADASIMPRIPNAALHAPTIMIGEKAADMILAGL